MCLTKDFLYTNERQSQATYRAARVVRVFTTRQANKLILGAP